MSDQLDELPSEVEIPIEEEEQYETITLNVPDSQEPMGIAEKIYKIPARLYSVFYDSKLYE